MSDEEKRDPSALARSILAKTGKSGASPASSGDAPDEPSPSVPSAAPADQTRSEPEEPEELPAETSISAHPDHSEAAELIDLYFTLDDPLERDACFDEIAASNAPVVLEFMRAVLQGDEDEYVRASAAAELARRGDAEGKAALLDDLTDPENIDFFSHALQTLSEVEGEPFYDRLLEIWQTDEHDADLVLEVLATMETLNPERALRDFESAIDAVVTPEQFRDDQFEAMVMAFVRAGHDRALERLIALRERAASFTLDPADQRELLGFIDEGIALLRDGEAPTTDGQP